MQFSGFMENKYISKRIIKRRRKRKTKGKKQYRRIFYVEKLVKNSQSRKVVNKFKILNLKEKIVIKMLQKIIEKSKYLIFLNRIC